MWSALKRWFGRKPSPVDDELAWLMPPSDVHDRAAWDRYWADQIANGLSPGIFDLFLPDEALMHVMVERGLRTVLCAGNGISQEPRILAEAGFDVTALDSSPEALRIAASFASEGDVSAVRKLDFVVGDLLDSRSCPGPFDVVIERRTLQLFSERERGTALDALLARLHPEGILVSHCHDGRWRPGEERIHQITPLLLEKGLPIWHGSPSQKPPGRVAWTFMSTG